MALIRWLKPGELPSLGGWDLWRLREIGAWGDLGRRVGARWEQVGGAALDGAARHPVVHLWRDRSLGRWMGSLGVPNPDAILVEPGGDGRVTLRPVDLKWSIDTAEYAQIAGERLRQLFERGGDRLRNLLPPGSDEPRFGDGLFAAPDRPLTALFLRSAANRKREYPLEQRELLALPIDPATFFAPLPGWSVALRLAELDRTRGLDRDVELADRYYHLGVGVWGALVAEGRSIFADGEGVSDDDLLTVDSALDGETLGRLDALVRERGLRSTRDVVALLAPRQRTRVELRARRRAIERVPYRFPDFLSDARKTGREGSDPAELVQLRELYKRIAQAHAADVRARGRALVVAGRSDGQALDELTAEEGELKRLARQRAKDALRGGSRVPTTPPADGPSPD